MDQTTLFLVSKPAEMAAGKHQDIRTRILITVGNGPKLEKTWISFYG